jgi:hypothetical protein
MSKRRSTANVTSNDNPEKKMRLVDGENPLTVGEGHYWTIILCSSDPDMAQTLFYKVGSAPAEREAEMRKDLDEVYAHDRENDDAQIFELVDYWHGGQVPGKLPKILSGRNLTPAGTWGKFDHWDEELPFLNVDRTYYVFFQV